VSRPSYLARRGDGRYFLQIRLGKQAAQLFGLPLLRVSLRTGNFNEARLATVALLPAPFTMVTIRLTITARSIRRFS
jgi:hypothetical protein